jgi:hypothetical protein
MSQPTDEDALRVLVWQFRMLPAWRIEQGKGDDPHPDSQYSEDDAAAYPFLISAAVRQALGHSIDHLRTLDAVVRDAKVLPLSASFSLLRGALENAATVVWLLNPAAREERVRRRLQLQRADLIDAERMVGLGFPTSGPTFEAFRARMLEVGKPFGLLAADFMGRPPGFGAIVRTAGEAVAGLGGDLAEGAWCLCSGLSHGRSWALNSISRDEHVADLGNGISEVLIQASPTAVASVAQHTSLMMASAFRLHRIAYKPSPLSGS